MVHPFVFITGRCQDELDKAVKQIGKNAMTISTRVGSMSSSQTHGILCIVMGAGGVAYITIFSELYTIGMKSAPRWIGARVLAVYLLILNGGLAVGSVIWGMIANTIGIPITLSVASLALAATILTRKRYSTTVVDDLDFAPAGSDYWSLHTNQKWLAFILPWRR